MIGEYGVGKSSLFRRFTTNSFVTATDRTVTLGLDNYGKVFEVSYYLKDISFVNSVCTIFCVRKQGTLHQTFQSLPELTSAVSLRKQGTCADTVDKMNGL